MKTMLSEIIGGTSDEMVEEYENRSAIYWAEEIDVPLIILHGSNDWRVDPSQAERMAEQLENIIKIIN